LPAAAFSSPPIGRKRRRERRCFAARPAKSPGSLYRQTRRRFARERFFSIHFPAFSGASRRG
jgi:hypothetical protein